MDCGTVRMSIWRPEPEPGTPICLGFDGSDFDDWSALKAETIDGLIFTPRYGADALPTIWNPKEWPDGRTPRTEVHSAVGEVFGRFKVERFYADPPRWETDVDQWVGEYGDEVVVEWPTYRPRQMHEALERFVTDLSAGRITQDGCPITSAQMANARKLTRGSRYVIGKPNNHQKVDAAMATVLAHEGAADARAEGWGDSGPTIIFPFA